MYIHYFNESMHVDIRLIYVHIVGVDIYIYTYIYIYTQVYINPYEDRYRQSW
jgi:hypothetical protein